MEPSEPYDIETDWGEGKQYPNAGKPGVYLLLDKDLKILLIGKASCNHVLGKRLGHYFKASPDKKKGTVRNSLYRDVRYVVTIPVTKAFHAPAIEEYLISVLDPQFNTLGKRLSSTTDPLPPADG